MSVISVFHQVLFCFGDVRTSSGTRQENQGKPWFPKVPLNCILLHNTKQYKNIIKRKNPTKISAK